MTDAFAEVARLQRAKAGKPEIVDVPEIGFLMIDGSGDPAGGAAYAEAVEALYAVDPRRTAPQRLRTILRHPVA